MRWWLTLLACFLTAGAAPPSEAPVEIREWPVPWKDTRPRDPAVDTQGRVWFVGQTGDYIGRLDPVSGEFGRFELEKGTGPHNLIVAPDGQIWFAGNRAAYIGRLDPKSGKIAKVPMPDPAAKDPHTLAAAPNGDLWFTVQFGGYIGKLEPKSGAVRLVKVPTRGARPYGIVVDPAGKPWFNEFGTNALGSIDPKTCQRLLGSAWFWRFRRALVPVSIIVAREARPSSRPPETVTIEWGGTRDGLSAPLRLLALWPPGGHLSAL